MFQGFAASGAASPSAASGSIRGPSDQRVRKADAAFRTAIDAVAETQREIDALHARRARRIAAAIAAAEEIEIITGAPTARTAEFAHRSTRAEIAAAMRASEATVERAMTESARLVTRLPRTLAAVARGAITWRAAVLITEAAGPLIIDRAGGMDRVADFESHALELAGRVAPSRLRTRLVALQDRLRATPAVERHRAAAQDRRVSLEDVGDGMSWLSAYLPSVEAHAVFHRLTDVARAARDLDGEDGIDDPRTLDQRRADLLVDFLAGDHVRIAGPGGVTAEEAFERRIGQGRDFGRFAGIRPTVVVTVPVQALVGRSVGAEGGVGAAGAADSIPAMLDGTVPIDPATARELTANAPGLYRLLVDPHSGASLDLSRTRYQPSTELRLWLRLRDETCRFPGCGRLARGADLDHTIDWQYGGPTSAANLAHLCRGHHTLKHQTRWRMTQHADGVITWRSPSGREYATRPGPAEPHDQAPGARARSA